MLLTLLVLVLVLVLVIPSVEVTIFFRLQDGDHAKYFSERRGDKGMLGSRHAGILTWPQHCSQYQTLGHS